MKNIYVYCEGSTEESFVNNILNPYLAPSEIFVYPIVCRTSQKRGIKYTGGVSRYGKIRFELSQLCKEHHNEIVTTMLDYYGLPQDTPGYHTEEGDLYQKIEKIETAVCQDIGLPNLHFNLTVHEFEGLLFSQPSAFISIVDAATVEEINKKIVEAKMKEMVNLDDEDGITILKDKGYNLKIEVDTTKKSVSDAIKLLNPDNIIDINISNVPLEDIISDIYKSRD